MMNITYRPIGPDWPGKRTAYGDRKHTPFRRAGSWDGTGYVGRGEMPWSDTLTLLGRELRYLGATNIVFQLDLSERDIRLDGLPRADAKPVDPAVILSFQSKHGPLRYFCDRFRGWQDNIRAIALGLEALRKVERYGITNRGEQYAGWKQLPPGSGVVEGVVRHFATPAEAASFMIQQEGGGASMAAVMDDRTYRNEVFKRAAKRAHPDAGGSRSDWDSLVEARRILESGA
jgi:hypothetical protein